MLAPNQTAMSAKLRHQARRACDRSGHFQKPLAVPVGDTFLRILGETGVLGAVRNVGPWRRVIGHDLDVLHGPRQWRVDGRSERVDPVFPARIPYPERASALRAEMPARLGYLLALALAFRESRAIDGDALFAVDLERLRCAHDVDGIAAAACRLATDRAIA